MFARKQLAATVFLAFLVSAGALWFAAIADSSTTARRKKGTSTPERKESSTGPRPRAVVDNSKHDFGLMEVGEERRHVFVIRNEGDAPLKMMQGATTCKCTFLNMKDGELAPGQSAEVELAWKPTESAAHFRQIAAIDTNDPDRPEVRLIADGRVVPVFSVLPTEVWQVGEILEDEPTEVSGTICSAARKSFRIDEVSSTHPLLTATVSPLEKLELDRLEARSGYSIRAKIAPGLPIGPFLASLKLRTDLPGGEEIHVALEAEHSGPIRFLGQRWDTEHRMFHLGNFNAKEGRRATLSVFLRPTTADKNVTLELVNVEPADLQVTPKLDPTFSTVHQKRFEIAIEFPAGNPPVSHGQGNPLVNIELKTNLKGLERVTVPVEFVAF